MKFGLCFLFCLMFLNITQAKNKESVKAANNLCFIENNGQVKDQFAHPRADIQVTLQTEGLSIFIGDGQIHYQFAHRATCDFEPLSYSNKVYNEFQVAKENKKNIPASEAWTYRLDVELIGANKNAEVIKDEQQQYYENYYLPNCPIEGIHARSYNRITYKDIFPNIDWVLYLKGGKLEHEFIVRPGGNVADIKLKYNGQTSLKINEDDGSITAITPLGAITEQAPLCYKTDGSRVFSAFKLRKNILSYDVDGYEGAVVIDPVVAWGTYYGGDTNSTYVFNITCDDTGNIYACGFTYCNNIGVIATVGAFQDTCGGGGNSDAFLAKFDSSGHRLWGTYFGGTENDMASIITCDHTGHIYMGGYTSSDTGIATPGTQEPLWGGGLWDGFLAKFTPAGMRQWCTYVGGTVGSAFDNEISSVCFDLLGHVYVSGACDDTSNISTPGCFKRIKTEGVDHYDCFLIQYDTVGIRQWGTYYGGNHNDFEGASCTDGENVYLAGWSDSDTGLSTSGSYQPHRNGSTDAFIAKFDASGHRIWGTYYGGVQQETEAGIVYSDGSLYIYGTTQSDTGMASPGCFQPLRGGRVDVFLAKFAPQTGTRQWGTYYGGPDLESTYFGTISADNEGNIYIDGSTISTSGIASPCSWQTTTGGGEDAFFAKYNKGGVQQWATYFGGNGDDRGMGCTTYGRSVYLCGNTTSTDKIATLGSFLATGGGVPYYNQGFLAKFVDPPHIDSIFGKISICVNDTTTLIDSTTGGVWSSSDSSVAAVNPASGVVTGISSGAVIITYSLSTCNFVSFNIIVNTLPSPITGNNVCDSMTASLSSTPSGGVWTSHNSSIAKVDSILGLVAGISTGTTTITYTLPTGCSLSTNFTVENCPEGVPVINNTGSAEIYPDPATNEIIIALKKDRYSTYTIKDGLGQLILHREILNSVTHVNIESLIPSVYYMILKGDSGIMVKKFTKQ